MPYHKFIKNFLKYDDKSVIKKKKSTYHILIY